jgi:NAD(P)-dependent dehydrogenase (short-subunit alcohol dehydrogenase family)
MAVSMHGKTCVITGASGGIGRATALALGKMGARLMLVCRDAARGGAVADEITSEGGSAGVQVLLADLSSQASICKLAPQILEQCPRLDVLINNVGGIFWQRMLTADGLETTLAVNHLAYFLLTQLLLDRIKASAPSRIINVASRAHRRASGIPFDDLQAERRYDAWLRYGETKLANILFTRELAWRLVGTGVTVNALHPGVVASGFGKTGSVLRRLGLMLARPFLLSPEQGAQTVIYLATSPEVATVTGKYFVKCAEGTPTSVAQDDALARRLWEVSAKLTGLAD